MSKKILGKSSILLGALVLPFLAGCDWFGTPYQALDTDIVGEVSVMLWSGDGNYVEDIGSLNLQPEDLTGQNQATVYAIAKAFKVKYPNVKVNVYAKSGGPNAGDVSWDQELENFKTNYGTYPSLWASENLVKDVKKGIVADISQFSNDPIYQSFNPEIMETMNYYGKQFGLPQYLLPWGVYVNKELATQNNIDIPDVNWDLEDYTDFVSEADGVNFWGAMDTPFSFLFTGADTLSEQLRTRMKGGTGNYVNVNSPQVRALLQYIPEWADSAIWSQFDVGNVPVEVMDANWWWSHKFFIENKILTNDSDPWMMGDAANPTPGHWAGAKSTDWDIYPRPATPYQGNTVGLVLDPFAIRNTALDDGNPEVSEAEATQLKLNYTFASFWVGDSAAWQARADQMFLDGDALKSAMNDSFPLTTGAKFDEQMEIWYQPAIHQRFKEKVGNQFKMPGFQEVLRLFKEGQIWDVSDKATPWSATIENNVVSNLYEWQNMWNPAVVTGTPGATSPRRTDANWLSTVLTKLAEWNIRINERFTLSVNELQAALIEFYGMEESDFN